MLCTTPDGASLVVLEIGWNPIGDDGISLLIEGLKENKVLVNLSAPSCEITVKGEISLYSYFALFYKIV